MKTFEGLELKYKRFGVAEINSEDIRKWIINSIKELEGSDCNYKQAISVLMSLFNLKEEDIYGDTNTKRFKRSN